MSQILITPLEGTARSINGRVLTGGYHYLLVEKNQPEVLNFLTLGVATAIADLEIEQVLSPVDVDKLVAELENSRKQEEGESLIDYRANLYRFAVESLLSKLEEDNKEVEGEDAEKTVAAPKTGKNSGAKGKTNTDAEDVN